MAGLAALNHAGMGVIQGPGLGHADAEVSEGLRRCHQARRGVQLQLDRA